MVGCGESRAGAGFQERSRREEHWRGAGDCRSHGGREVREHWGVVGMRIVKDMAMLSDGPWHGC